MVYKKTGQKILFRGADKVQKLKSTKVTHGYIRYIWYEELDEFCGMKEIRSINPVSYTHLTLPTNSLV